MMKDPQENRTGNRRNEGRNEGRHEPPDLDELWRDFNRRLNRLFRRKTGAELPPDSNSSNDKRHYYIAALIAALGLWLGSGMYMVRQGQAAAVFQFGAYKKTTTAGLHWRLPYPFQSHETIDLSNPRSVEIGRNSVIRLANVKDSSMFTQDGQIINVRFNVRYSVDNVQDFLFNHADPDIGVMQAAETAAREIVKQRKMTDLLANGREQLGSALVPAIQKILDVYKSGIRINEVVMQSVQLPEQMQAVFDQMQKANEVGEKQKNDAQTYANAIIPSAQNKATQMISEAEAYKAQAIAQAGGDVERFKPLLAAFLKTPTAIREHLYLDTMQQIYQNSTKIFVDGSKAASAPILLPFDWLKSAQSPQSAPATDLDSKSVNRNEEVEISNNATAASSSADNQALRRPELLRSRELSEQTR